MKPLKDLFDLLFPHSCFLCGNTLNGTDQSICFLCNSQLPRTRFWSMEDNPLQKDLAAHTDVSHALAFLYFARKSKTRQILHEIKYKGNGALAEQMGAQFGRSLRRSGWAAGVFDALVPVTITRKKRLKRGYNQSHMIAQGMSEELKIPILNDILHRSHSGASQTSKGRTDRFESIRDSFRVNADQINDGDSLLLIDDVYTTGATSVRCLNLLKEGGTRKLGFASLAYRSGI